MKEFFETIVQQPLWLLPLWFVIASVILFALMGSDKRKAQSAARRTPEKTLFLWALLGGAVGGTLGMRVFRHKTKHWYFAWGFPVLAVLQLALCVWLLWRGISG